MKNLVGFFSLFFASSMTFWSFTKIKFSKFKLILLLLLMLNLHTYMLIFKLSFNDTPLNRTMVIKIVMHMRHQSQIQNFKCLFCKRLTKIIEWAKRDKVLSVAKNKLITIFIRLLNVSRKQETKNETGCQEVHLQIQGGGSGGGSLFQFAFHAFHALKTDIKLSLIQGFF